MSRQRPQLGTPFGTDGPWLAAILDVLGDLHELLDARLPQPRADAGKGPVRISEPAPDRPPVDPTPVSEPAPDNDPETDEDEEQGPEQAIEPAPDLPERPHPEPPPRHGKGSGLEAWQTFADAAGVTVAADASRADIITACERARVIAPA